MYGDDNPSLTAPVVAPVGTLVVMTAMNIFTAEGIRLVNYPRGLGIGGVYMTMFILWSIGVSISTFRYR